MDIAGGCWRVPAVSRTNTRKRSSAKKRLQMRRSLLQAGADGIPAVSSLKGSVLVYYTLGRNFFTPKVIYS
jgi:hypothetical protein